MVTTKALRTPPPRKLTNYVASVKKLFGDPETISDKEFLRSGKYVCTYASADEHGVGYDEDFSVVEPIGFEIEINGKKYKEFSVATAGWMMLRDPNGGSTSSTFYNDVVDDPISFADGVQTNEFILSDFLYDHIILAPWFDASYTTADSIDQLLVFYYNGLTTKSDVDSGKDTKNYPFDLVDKGVRYVNGYDSKKGKYLIVRWTLSQANYKNRIKFEVALYENGKIEYRYWPTVTYVPGVISAAECSATVGAFWSGPSQGSNKFRDFSPLLDYRKSERKIHELGGSIYDLSYAETSDAFPAATKPYSLNIPYSYWPKNGAVITFSPPKNPIKFLPRKLTSIISANREIVRSAARFDDRKTINFFDGSIVVNMPSTLPTRLLGDTGETDVSLRQFLFTSGSIQVNGSVRKSIVDSQLEQLNAIEETNRSIDMSFNESQKDYSSTNITSSFYSTGSPLEDFGEGFTSPLKSKTQFQFFLPVTKQVTMPSITSSLYYYDNNRKTWSMVNPNGYRGPSPMVAWESSEELGITNAVRKHLHKVVETSRGFDAVGRKIVSGSNNIDFSGFPQTYQTDNRIGAVFNYSNQKIIGYDLGSNTDVTTEAYSKSLTDNLDFYPADNQTITFPTDYPFLIEKIVVDIPVYIEGDWFKDRTTCNRAFGNSGAANGIPSGAIDFGGPGLTFALMCPRKVYNNSYIDLIASGTITHEFDDISSVEITKNSLMRYYSIRPVGFRSFSNPTAVISGTFDGVNYKYDGKVRLEMQASVAGGLTLARNDRSLLIKDASYVSLNRTAAIQLLTKDEILTKGEIEYNVNDTSRTFSTYSSRSPRIYIQQVSPLARGTSKIEFNGNSLLGGTLANFDVPKKIKNPLYLSESGSLPSGIKSKIDSANFNFEAVSIYSITDSKPSPYLIMPGDKLMFSISKTRPIIYRAINSGDPIPGLGAGNIYRSYQLTGSHGTVMLNTGSIDITVYGSYVREGMEYNP